MQAHSANLPTVIEAMNDHYTFSQDLCRLTPPWGSRPSIYAHLAAHLSDNAVDLPDEEIVEQNVNGLCFAPGAFDHIIAVSAEKDILETVYAALQELAGNATDETAATLYTVFTTHDVRAYHDHLLEAIIRRRDIQPVYLHAIGHWLATGAADRSAVKVGIALLGITCRPKDRQLLLTLGRHDEFTECVTMALKNGEDDVQPGDSRAPGVV